jgi:putative membrane protein
MIIRFSDKLWQQVYSTLRNNKTYIAIFIFWSATNYILYHYLDWKVFVIPMGPVALLGGGLAFFLGFRNNAAYDRWWEARKIWGGIVNTCRSFGAAVTSTDNDSNEITKWKRTLIYNHLAWINAIRIQLRTISDWNDVTRFMSESDYEDISKSQNKATQIGALQTRLFRHAKRNNWIDPFEHKILFDHIEELFSLQGKAERIKNTVFPYFYQYFTRVFLWMFIFLLPGALVGLMGWQSIPLAVFVSFIFYILERTSNITDQPLHPRSSGTPMNQICRAIEIDLKEQLGETDVPEPMKTKLTRHGSVFHD